MGLLEVKADWADLVGALRFAALWHRDQRRKDEHGSPYINHPIEAVHLLTEVGGVRDPRVLIAAALHDVLEDTVATGDDLERRFGAGVRRLVEEVTDPPGLPTDERRRRQLVAVRTASPEARLIRLADKVANLSTLPRHWTADQRQAYLQWVGQMAKALAGTNPELEALLARRLREETARPFRFVPQFELSARAAREVAKLVARRLKHLAKLLGQGELLADEMTGVLGTLGLTDDGPEPKPRRATANAGPRFTEEHWFLTAEPGVASVDIQPTDRHTSMVSIDGAEAFPLSFTLAALLDLLCRGEGDSPDQFVPFQSYEALASRLSGVTGRHATPHAIVVAVGRLREKILKPGKRSPRLVETLDGVGARFRLRRPA